MNKYNQESIGRIKSAAKDFQKEVTRTYQRYRQTISAAKQAATAYKDENSYLTGKKDTAAHAVKNDVAMAQNVFAAVAKAEISNLKDELNRHLISAPSDRFLTSLSVYADYGLTPNKMEIAALMQQAGGNSLSLRALDAVLQKTHSKYRIAVPGAEDFEKDIDMLQRLTEGGIMWRPHEYHSEAVAVYGESPRMIRREDGTYYDAGYVWDNISILSASGDFDQKIKNLDNMAGRWTDAVLPTVYIADAYTGHMDEKTGERVSGAQEYVNDYHATVKAGAIIDNPDAEVERIRAQAEIRAQEDTKAREIVKAYTGGTTA